MSLDETLKSAYLVLNGFGRDKSQVFSTSDGRGVVDKADALQSEKCHV